MTKTLKSLSLATSIAVSAGFAANAMAVTASMSGQGDLHFVPVSVLSGGWKTEVSLINSSTTNSVVTKAVIKSQHNSRECLDFMVYLSPGDRFVGTFMESSSLPEGVTAPSTDLVFYSTDDSVINLSGAPASAAAPAVYPVQNYDGGCDISYVQFIQSATYDNADGDNDNDGLALGTPTVSKSDIKMEHDADIAAGGFNTIDDATMNVVSGSYILSNMTNGIVMSDTMSAFADYDNTVYLSTGNITLLGQNTVDGLGIASLEAAMAKQNIKVPYEHDDAGEMTIAAVTFPTKQSYYTSNSPTSPAFPSYGNSATTVPSTYSPLNTSGVVGIGSGIRDMEERLLDNRCLTQGGQTIISPPDPTCSAASNPESLPAEVNLIVVSDKILSVATLTHNGAGDVVDSSTLAAQFTKGWYNINLEADADGSLAGAPVLVNTIQLSTNALGAAVGTIKKSAHD